MNRQAEHERLLDELNALAGRHVYDFYRDTAHLTGEKLELAKKLNAENDLAVDLYYKRRCKKY